MRQSKLYVKTTRDVPVDEVSKNAILLTRAGFIHKEMAGVYSYLPMGNRVLTKIENIIRKHMDNVGVEILMSSLAPKEKWEDTHRMEEVDVLMKTCGANEKSKEKSSNEYILNSTHEEIVTPIAKEYLRSYKDFPAAFYQIQTKFRNEARAKSGILRGREFRMKDLYSFHSSESDLLEYYNKVKSVYMDFYKELGIGEFTFPTLASGGDFTKEFSHEFQTIVDVGEDEIYLDRKNGIAYNKEIVNPETESKLGIKFSEMEVVKACEVGNIFPLNTKFSDALDYNFTDSDGEQKRVYMGCYGIGSTRTMGVIVEKFADEKGLVWPKNISPFQIHLVSLHKEIGDGTYLEAERIYNDLTNSPAKHEVLWDDRMASPGVKLNDADLFGISIQIVVGEKGLSRDIVEVVYRKTGEKLEVPKDAICDKMGEIWQKAF